MGLRHVVGFQKSRFHKLFTEKMRNQQNGDLVCVVVAEFLDCR